MTNFQTVLLLTVLFVTHIGIAYLSWTSCKWWHNIDK
jgi:hypothetical protein